MRLLLLMVTGLMGSLIKSRAQESVFQRLTMHDGLPSDYVMVMMVDQKGACWIGTDKGLCRYDGAGIQVLTMDDGLSSNHISALLQDHQQRIWAGLSAGGMVEIAFESGRLRILGTYQVGMNIRRIHQDKHGLFTIVEQTADGKAKIWQTLDMAKPWAAVCTITQPMEVAIDAHGQIWTTPDASVFWHQPAARHRVAFLPGKDKNIRIAAAAHKVAVWNRKQAVIYDLRYPGDSTLIAFQDVGNEEEPLRFFSNDSLDFFYKSTNGIWQFRSGKLQKLLQYPKSLKQLHAFEMAMDSTGHLLISDFGNGIVFWQAPYATFYANKLPVRRIALHRDAVSYSTEASISIIRQGRVTEITPRPHALPVNFHVVDTFRQRLIIGGYNTLFDQNSRSLFAEHPEFNDFSDLVFTHDSCFISSYTWGVYLTIGGKVDWRWKNALNMPRVNIERLRLFGNNLYALTLSHGFWRIQLPQKEVIHYSTSQGLPSNSIYDLFQEHDSLWVASAKGLSLLLKDTAYHFTQQQGFDGNRALCVFRDRKKNLWLLSDKYLHLFRAGRLYPIQSHPLNTDSRSYLINARYQPNADILWVGTNKGLLGVYPDSIVPVYRIAMPDMEAIRVDGKVVLPKDSLLELAWSNQSLQVKFNNLRHGLHSRAMLEIRLLGHQSNFTKVQNDYLVEYNRLPPGKYALEMRVNGPDFVHSAPRTMLYITVRPPWWKSNWFMLLAAGLLAALTVLATWYIYAYRYRQRLKAMEAAKALEVERSRISRELHDNVGSMLTVMINKLEDEPQPNPEQGAPIQQIARSTLSHLRDAIWALDTPRLTMDLWNGRTIDFLQTMMRPGLQLHWQFDWPNHLELSPIKALHSFRILQEACNNAVKHSGCSSISVSGRWEERLMLTISDNGKGFAGDQQKPGYGLRNMRKRAKEIGGELEIQSQPGKGTTVNLAWSAEEHNHPNGV